MAPHHRAELPKARHLRCSPAAYQRDPCDSPSLNASVAHAIVSRSPLHGYSLHPRLGGASNGTSKAMDDGTVIHTLLLGNGAELSVFDVKDFRSAEVREARDIAQAQGRVVIKKTEFDRLSEVAALLRERCASLGFPLNARSEYAVEWWDRAKDGEPVRCRSMFDHVNLERGHIIDLKKVATANPRDTARHFYDYGYDIAYAAYTRALGALRPEFLGRTVLTYLYVEILPPYSVVPAVPDGAMREIGAQRWARAVESWQRGLRTGEWPDYCIQDTVTLETPGYLIRDELGESGVDYM